jgi:hypothetical protein
MTTPKRTPREELLTTLSDEERAALVPLSASTIRKAVAEGERDCAAVSVGAQLSARTLQKAKLDAKLVGSSMAWVPVRILFLSRSLGGRTMPPSGGLYACTAVFAHGLASEEWSVVLDLATRPRLRFLVDDAPFDLLVPGLQLELREGARTVGAAVVRPTMHGSPRGG